MKGLSTAGAVKTLILNRFEKLNIPKGFILTVGTTGFEPEKKI